MPKVTRICRVCGKEYPYCKTYRDINSDKMIWQDVACSPECGKIYFDRILKSRSKSNAEESVENVSKKIKKTSKKKIEEVDTNLQDDSE